MRRLREYRKDQKTRDEYAEVQLSVRDLIYPYFVVEGENVKKEIPSLQNVFHFSIDKLLEDIGELQDSGVDKVLLFGVVEDNKKNEKGTAAYSENNLIARTVKAVKEKFPKLTVITDVCLCGYTDHGHCGLVQDQEVLNDETLPLLSKTALTHAKAGADIVAPSAMMDGQVAVIRKLLDEKGFKQTKILAYSAKYASNFYGPFREAVKSAPSFGDRKTYQMDYRNVAQAIEEVKSDLEEGAAWVMVKPAAAYLDVINNIKQNFPKVKLAAYQVSGEYAMLKTASSAGLLVEEQAVVEALTAIKRAGADLIITYYAKDAGRWLKN